MMNMMGMVSAMSGGSSASDPFVNMHNGFKQRFNQTSIESPTKNDNTYVNPLMKKHKERERTGCCPA